MAIFIFVPKQIEKMAKVLRQHICEDKPCDECNYHGKTKILPRYCEAYIHSKTLYNAGYRKEEQVRKEMAEKFAEMAKAKKKYITSKSYNTCEVVFIKDIDEICKELTGDKE